MTISSPQRNNQLSLDKQRTNVCSSCLVIRLNSRFGDVFASEDIPDRVISSGDGLGATNISHEERKETSKGIKKCLAEGAYQVFLLDGC